MWFSVNKHSIYSAGSVSLLLITQQFYLFLVTKSASLWRTHLIWLEYGWPLFHHRVGHIFDPGLSTWCLCCQAVSRAYRWKMNEWVRISLDSERNLGSSDQFISKYVYPSSSQTFSPQYPVVFLTIIEDPKERPFMSTSHIFCHMEKACLRIKSTQEKAEPRDRKEESEQWDEHLHQTQSKTYPSVLQVCYVSQSFLLLPKTFCWTCWLLQNNLGCIVMIPYWAHPHGSDPSLWMGPYGYGTYSEAVPMTSNMSQLPSEIWEICEM